MKYNKTILIVDDIEANIDILLKLLGDEYDILVALNGDSALEILESEQVDLILLDIMMPQMNGYEVCSILKSKENLKSIPIIFITAKTDEDSIEKAYEVGGSDYITKPFKPRELMARIKTQLKLKDVICHLEFIASHDEMTGIYNRRKFFSLSQECFSKNKKDLCAVMIDIDKFKIVNDTYGHAIGDEVIKLVTQTINQNIFDDAIFGRIGGEEFAIVCYSSDPEAIIKNIDSTRQKIENLEVKADDGAIVKFTISNGIAKVTDKTLSLDELLKEADTALYEAKGSGRNRVIFR
ncbi:MAG: diguanylate cyclase [Campylobacterota bacterium]|nr:diguanylate cyclase [Campylobacterota bacterium]